MGILIFWCRRRTYCSDSSVCFICPCVFEGRSAVWGGVAQACDTAVRRSVTWRDVQARHDVACRGSNHVSALCRADDWDVSCLCRLLWGFVWHQLRTKRGFMWRGRTGHPYSKTRAWFVPGCGGLLLVWYIFLHLLAVCCPYMNACAWSKLRSVFLSERQVCAYGRCTNHRRETSEDYCSVGDILWWCFELNPSMSWWWWQSCFPWWGDEQ